MKLRLEARPDHMLVVAEGGFTVEEARAGLARVLAECQKLQLKKLFIDLRAITTAIPVADRYDLAARLAADGPKHLRTALLMSPDNMFSKAFEDTATNRGANVLTTASLEEALAYLELPTSAAGA